MEYSIDLLNLRNKSIFSLVVGILIFLWTLVWFIVSLTGNSSVTFFDLTYFVLMLLNGLLITNLGLGNPIERLFGKAFIEINNQIIRVKTGVFDNEQSVEWSEINSVNYNSGIFIITKKDSSIYHLSVSKFEYKQLQEVKGVINNIASDKSISINLKS